jgi:hypothetical protein
MTEANEKSKRSVDCGGKTYSPTNPIPRFENSHSRAVLDKDIGAAKA